MADSLVVPMVVTMVTLTAVSFIFMGLRMFSKYLASSKPSIDDAVLIFSWVRCLVLI